jgi:hypothetical protein
MTNERGWTMNQRSRSWDQYFYILTIQNVMVCMLAYSVVGMTVAAFCRLFRTDGSLLVRMGGVWLVCLVVGMCQGITRTQTVRRRIVFFTEKNVVRTPSYMRFLVTSERGTASISQKLYEQIELGRNYACFSSHWPIAFWWMARARVHPPFWDESHLPHDSDGEFFVSQRSRKNITWAMRILIVVSVGFIPILVFYGDKW